MDFKIILEHIVVYKIVLPALYATILITKSYFGNSHLRIRHRICILLVYWLSITGFKFILDGFSQFSLKTNRTKFLHFTTFVCLYFTYKIKILAFLYLNSLYSNRCVKFELKTNHYRYI